MHDDIKRHSLEGEIDDTNIVKRKDRLVHALEDQMRSEGAVPCLDLDPQFTLDYNPETETYKFTLSMWGIDIEGDSWQTAGIMSGMTIMRHTAPPKSKAS